MDGDTYLGLKVRCVEVISWGNMLLYYYGYNIIHIGKQQTVPGLQIKRSSTNQIKTMTNFRLLYSRKATNEACHEQMALKYKAPLALSKTPNYND